MKATKATNSRGKSATELEEVKEKKETQIFSKWNDTDFKICTKTKKRIKCNEIKGEEHEETVEFFLTIYHSFNFVNIFLFSSSDDKWNGHHHHWKTYSQRKEENRNISLPDNTIFGDP